MKSYARWWAALWVLAGPPAWAASAAPDLHGIALGMTADEAKAASHLPCVTQPYSSDIACEDVADGSDYNATFSAGRPSVALSVEHSFCSHDDTAAVLVGVLARFGAAETDAAADPNGFHVDLTPDTEAILNADDSTCPAGRGKHYVLSIRSNALLTRESNRAVERARKAVR